MKKIRKKNLPNIIYATISIFIFAALLFMLVFFLLDIEKAEKKEAAWVLESSLKKAAVNCYAIEGFYPPTIKYIEDNYNVYINKNSFTVHYETFASNIMPNIIVFEKGG